MAAIKASRQILIQAHSLPHPWQGVQVGINTWHVIYCPKNDFYSLKWLQFKAVWMCVCLGETIHHHVWNISSVKTEMIAFLISNR